MIDLEAVKILMSRVLDYVWHDFPPDGEEGFGKTSAKQIINQLVAEVERTREGNKSLKQQIETLESNNDKLSQEIMKQNAQLAEANKEIEELRWKLFFADDSREKQLVAEVEYQMSQVIDLEAKLTTLTEQHAKAVECIKYYSNEYNFLGNVMPPSIDCPVSLCGYWDRGFMAKCCLKELGVKDE